ncbi:unnamed protein product [Notodromas monacha]|uniref:Malonyl-CoA decarboxylase C-terminal domain-containing protein n=1 Tax=Notodromas monacha TaxID=399045 RepID=A0A7R9BFV0_9CRUS|nr:unnamed protein product [Notodromas monacha]CAG0913724.1 unnamed protein product [Notodromas monacha]
MLSAKKFSSVVLTSLRVSNFSPRSHYAFASPILRHYLHSSPQQPTLSALENVVREVDAIQTLSSSAVDAVAEKFRWTFNALEPDEKSYALLLLASKFKVDASLVKAQCEDFIRVSVRQAEISKRIKSGDLTSSQQLRQMDTVLFNLMTMWFGREFLSLERLTWESSCSLLEKIAEGEAVHRVRHWLDLKRRLGMYRRCFVFTHQAMPGEPLIVVHVALMPSITSSIQTIVQAYRQGNERLDELEDENKIEAAIFYSISSTQRGLRGVELGGHLIKKVVDQLRWEFPHLAKFSTLSPIPGFRSWLLVRMHEAERGAEEGLLTKSEIEQWNQVLGSKGFWKNAIDAIVNSTWCKSKEHSELFRPALLRLCARYLFKEKRRGFALDRVANFHLRNGAVLWRINWLADTSPKGLEDSCSMMVNYRYFLDSCASNSKEYIKNKVVAVEDHIVLEILDHINKKLSSSLEYRDKLDGLLKLTSFLEQIAERSTCDEENRLKEAAVLNLAPILCEQLGQISKVSELSQVVESDKITQLATSSDKVQNSTSTFQLIVLEHNKLRQRYYEIYSTTNDLLNELNKMVVEVDKKLRIIEYETSTKTYE